MVKEKSTRKRLIGTVLASLRANNFEAEYAQNGKIAKDRILEMIPDIAVVGVGDSVTLRQIGVLEDLKNRGTKVIDPFSKEMAEAIASKAMSREKWVSILKENLSSDFFLSSTNAVTLDGKLINIDAVGNRVAGMIFGPKKVIIVAGRNKIVKDVNEALHRIKREIAPVHVKTKDYGAPCQRKGRCIDCSAKHRICNITTIVEKKPLFTDLLLIIVDEDLGLGWNKNWSGERTGKILTGYARHISRT